MLNAPKRLLEGLYIIDQDACVEVEAERGPPEHDRTLRGSLILGSGLPNAHPSMYGDPRFSC